MTVNVPRGQRNPRAGVERGRANQDPAPETPGQILRSPRNSTRDSECRDPPLPGTQLTGPCLSVIHLSDIRLTGRITLRHRFGHMDDRIKRLGPARELRWPAPTNRSTATSSLAKVAQGRYQYLPVPKHKDRRRACISPYGGPRPRLQWAKGDSQESL